MRTQLVLALRLNLLTLAVTGLAYPTVVTVLAQALAPERARGSLVRDREGRVRGSELIAQEFRSPGYFHARPSVAGPGFDASASGASNLGPTSRRLRERVEGELARLRAENPAAPREVPDALVTTSASGLDPHLPPAAVQYQAPRVAAARGVTPRRLEAFIDAAIEGRALGVLGEPVVNVLLLNRALDAALGPPPGAPSASGQPAPGAPSAPAPNR